MSIPNILIKSFNYFKILKSRDGEIWSELTQIESAGNSTQLISYTTIDDNTYSGSGYYKLLQVDFDGKSKEYGPINVSCQSNDKSFSAFPNPNSGEFQILINNENLIGDCSIVIKDTKGSDIYNKTITVKPGVNVVYVENVKSSPGIYYIYLNGYEFTNVIKIVIK